MAFERFERHEAYTKGGAKVVATLTCDTKSPILVIGAKLLDLGFDVSKTYAYLFDRDKMLLALEESEKGFKVQVHSNQSKTSNSKTIAAQGFCSHFGLTERYAATNQIEHQGKRWILKLQKVKESGKTRK